MRPTIINPGPEWTLRSQPSLLAPAAAPRTLGAEEQREERVLALDLLDALTRCDGERDTSRLARNDRNEEKAQCTIDPAFQLFKVLIAGMLLKK